MNKAVIIAIVVVIAAAGWYVLSGHAGSNNTVATVNGTAITRAELVAKESEIAAQQGMVATSTAVQAQFQGDALNSLIGQTLLVQAAQLAGVAASSTQVDAQLAAARAQFGTQAEYDKALTAQGMTEADLRTQFSENSLINAYLDTQLNLSTATATPAEIAAAYNQVAAQQKGVPPLAQVRAQVAQMVVQQKQQISVNAYVAQLRSAAKIQIFIASSTPAQ